MITYWIYILIALAASVSLVLVLLAIVRKHNLFRGDSPWVNWLFISSLVIFLLVYTYALFTLNQLSLGSLLVLVGMVLGVLLVVKASNDLNQYDSMVANYSGPNAFFVIKASNYIRYPIYIGVTVYVLCVLVFILLYANLPPSNWPVTLMGVLTGGCILIINIVSVLQDSYNLSRQVNEILTGIQDRYQIWDSGQREVARARRYHLPISLILINIEQASQGQKNPDFVPTDQALQAVAVKLRKGLREIDIVGRYGTGLYVVILPETEREGAKVVAQRLKKQIIGVDIPTQAGKIHPQAKVGVATYSRSQDPLTFEALLDQARISLQEG